METSPTDAVLVKMDGTSDEWPDSVSNILHKFELGCYDSDGGWQPNEEFTQWMKSIITNANERNAAHEHRFVPGKHTCLFLALLPWRKGELYALHLLESNLVNDTQKALNQLTKREVDVLHWISEGKSNTSIGKLLQISAGTVRKHVENILVKLSLENRTMAARMYSGLWTEMH